MSSISDQELRLLSVCRVSSREQSEGYSLDAQAQANREWAERKGHKIADTLQYVETASKRKERRRFREIIDRVRRDHSIDGVVFHKVDRACRNIADLAMLEKLETEAKKRVFFSSQEFPQNAAGRLGVGVMGVAARWYTDNLKEEINKGFRAKIEAGEYPHTPPYGYRMGETADGRKLPVPDPERAHAIRTVFELMASGEYTLDTLRQELLERGLHFRPSSPRWNRAHLANLLRHPFYVGKIAWRGEIHPGKHEPLIDERTWRKVQDVLDGRSRARRRRRRSFTYGHGLIRCAHCGYRITGELHKGRYRYYRCAQVQYREHPIHPAWVPESEIESQITAMLGKLVLPEKVCRWAMTYLQRAAKQNAADRKQELQRLRRKASQARASLDGLLLKAVEVGDGLAESFMRLARQKQHELGLLEGRIKETNGSRQQDGRRAAKILELAQHLAERFLTLPSDQKRRITDAVFLNLRLDHVTLLGEYRLPFSILAENGNRPANSGRLDLNQRLPAPKAGALAKLSYAPRRHH